MTVASTHFLRDILRQPAELRRAVEHLAGHGKPALSRCAAMVEGAQHVFLTGIGASWHAAMGAGVIFNQQGRPVYTLEASELLYSASIPKDSVVVALSRTGRSIEIARLIFKIRDMGAVLIGITNSADSPLAKESDAAIVIPTPLDHAISVNTYSTLALGAAALAMSGRKDFESSFSMLSAALSSAEDTLPEWQQQLDGAGWLDPGARYYFLARGTSIATCFQARLLWEEGAKMPATAMSTSGFRHGPQEIVVPGMRFGMWIDASIMREQDLAVADDLKTLGASVMLVGQELPSRSEHLALALPKVAPALQFVVDVMPIQLAAERLARLAGADSDSFRVCSYIVEDEHGLLGRKKGA